MKIDKVEVANYVCYYGNNVFEFDSGLNIILGENGEGKTKFFEAIQWLIHGNSKDLEHLISEKKLKETEPGETFDVSVSLVLTQFEHEVTVTRSFTVTKDEDGGVSLSPIRFEGIVENNNGRSREDADRLLNQVFPSEVRKYSMFKGESELNIFENEDALINLIDLFSDAKRFDKYESSGKALFEFAQKAVDRESSKNNKAEKELKKITGDLLLKERELREVKELLEIFENESNGFESKIEQAESFVEHAEQMKTIKTRIENFTEELNRYRANLQEAYTTYLFDRSWVLRDFEPVFEEYSQKVINWSKEKRKQEQDFYKQQGEREGLVKLLSNDELFSDIGNSISELIKDKLETYLELQKPKPSENESPFDHDYLGSMTLIKDKIDENSLAELRKVDDGIIELFELNKWLYTKIKELEEAIEKEEAERSRVLGGSVKREESLSNILMNYNAWQRDLRNVLNRKAHAKLELDIIEEVINKLNSVKDRIERASASAFLIKSRDVIADIVKVFSDTKTTKFLEVLKRLGETSNDYFKRINRTSFTGHIVFQYKELGSGKVKIGVELHHGSDNRKIHRMSQALETSMHIAVLLAISKLTETSHKEPYPLIMDAPTSSFGETKTGDFLNIISETDGQIIILLKDFLSINLELGELVVTRNFNQVKRSKAFMLKLDRHDPSDISTLNTEVVNL